MVKTLFLSIVSLAISSSCFADIQRVTLPAEVQQEMREPANPDIKGKVWNRWTSENFVVCSINDTQAKFLHDHLEDVKSWIFRRWGLQDVKFSGECRLICVDDKSLFQKLFGIDRTKVEIRRDGGKIKMTVIYLLLDDKPAKTIPVPLTEVCLAQFEEAYQLRFGCWFHRGMALLNGTLPDIRQAIADQRPALENDDPVFFGQALFSLTDQQYAGLTPPERASFDRASLLACLLLRKEYGEDKFLDFLKATSNGSDAQAGLNKVYNFDYAKFDKLFKKYMFDLTAAITGQTKPPPDSYLQVNTK